MKIWEAIVLGLVQGLSEFLPISSSGHLVLLQNMFGVEEGVLFFDSMLHLGTLLAVLAVFYKSIWGMLRKPLQKKVYLFLCASAVTGVFGILLQDGIETLFGGGLLGVGFLMTSLILLLSERFGHGKKEIENIGYLQAAGVGLMQTVALLPGVSRSGSTIAGCRFFGLDREAAAEFSFLLSIPPILGSLLLQLKDVMETGTGGIGALCVAAGTLVAALSGYAAIRWMLRLLQNRSLLGFSVYTGVLGLLVLIDQYGTHFFF